MSSTCSFPTASAATLNTSSPPRWKWSAVAGSRTILVLPVLPWRHMLTSASVPAPCRGVEVSADPKLADVRHTPQSELAALVVALGGHGVQPLVEVPSGLSLVCACPDAPKGETGTCKIRVLHATGRGVVSYNPRRWPMCVKQFCGTNSMMDIVTAETRGSWACAANPRTLLTHATFGQRLAQVAEMLVIVSSPESLRF